MRLTVDRPEAAAAVPYIREQLDKMDIDVPLVGDFHYNGHTLLNDYPDCARALSKYRINPGNVGKGAKRDTQFAQMIEAACRYDKPVRIGVNWGSLDQALLARIMDENAGRAEPWPAQAVMYEALVTSAIENAVRAEELGLGRGQDHSVVQSVWCARFDRRVPRTGAALRLSAAPGPDGSGHGQQGHRGVHGGPGRAAAGRHWRHHPHLAHAPSRAATARAKSSSARKSCKPWACASSRPW